ncbi:MAG: ABC transporter substrate-binding protein [Holosporales bacterium]|jgi:putative ABC transport system substrate-binding protein|nr:ABC transporter substrate-binding protein [Holosporales bacterium]
MKKVELFEAILALETPDEAERFFMDLCTPREIKAMKERWQVCQLLNEKKLSYRAIRNETGASTTTVTRVSRFLSDEPYQGYSRVLRKLAISLPLMCNIEAYALKIWSMKAVEHEALNAVEKGFREGLEDEGDDIRSDTCQGSLVLAEQIAAKAVSTGGDIIVAIGTMPAQSVFRYAKDGKIKLIATSITDPSAIPTSAGTNTAIVSNFVPLEPQLGLFKKIQPGLRRLGIIYNTGEANSVAIVGKLRIIAPAFSIELVESCIQKSSDIPQAVAVLVKKVDAVFVSNDNTVLGGIEYVIRVFTREKKPVFVSDTDQVEKGCLAALGPNHVDIGRQTAKVIQRIKKGEDINDIEVQYPSSTELYLNKTVAGKIGIEIPKGILEKADKVL